MNYRAKLFKQGSALSAALALAIALQANLCLPASSAANGQSAFDALKALEGDWSGKDDDGQPAVANYEVSSGGTIVIEKLTPGKHPCMTSVYHRDKDSLMMTHYCNMDNQPRMRLSAYDAEKGTMQFEFVDITNLKNDKEGHINGLKISMPDKNHLEHDWTFSQEGKQAHAVFIFQRKAPASESQRESDKSKKSSSLIHRHQEISKACCSRKI